MHAVMAEVPRGPDTSDKVAAHGRIVETMMLHKVCNPNRCLKGIYGKPVTKCKYGFPYSTPSLAGNLMKTTLGIWTCEGSLRMLLWSNNTTLKLYYGQYL
jgi:hypothetical protein